MHWKTWLTICGYFWHFKYSKKWYALLHKRMNYVCSVSISAQVQQVTCCVEASSPKTWSMMVSPSGLPQSSHGHLDTVWIRAPKRNCINQEYHWIFILTGSVVSVGWTTESQAITCQKFEIPRAGDPSSEAHHEFWALNHQLFWSPNFSLWGITKTYQNIHQINTH